MKRVGRAGLRAAFWATLVCGGASGVVGVWAKEVAAAITRRRLRRVLRGKRHRMGDRVALM
jgi:ribosomal protein S5